MTDELGEGLVPRPQPPSPVVPPHPPEQAGPPTPTKGAAHILKSLLQSQADIGLDAGPFLPLPAKHFAEGGVGARCAH